MINYTIRRKYKNAIIRLHYFNHLSKIKARRADHIKSKGMCTMKKLFGIFALIVLLTATNLQDAVKAEDLNKQPAPVYRSSHDPGGSGW